MPADAIPVLCNRFKSRALFAALAGEVKSVPVEVPESVEFSKLSIQILREVCDHHYALLEIYKSEDGLDRNELDRLDMQVEQVIQRERLLYTLLEAEYEQRIALRRKQA